MLIKLIILRDLSQYQPSTNNFKNLSFEGDKRSMEVVWTFSLNFPLALMFLSWLVLLRDKVSKWGTQSSYTERGTSVMNCLHFILWNMYGLGSIFQEARQLRLYMQSIYIFYPVSDTVSQGSLWANRLILQLTIKPFVKFL